MIRCLSQGLTDSFSLIITLIFFPGAITGATGQRRRNDNSKRQRRQVSRLFALRRISIPTKKILIGFWLAGQNALKSIEKLCLSGTNELLFEMPMYRWSSSLRNTVLELNTRRDIRLVMAHADRYPVNDVREFIRAGIPLQLNVDSFLSFRKRAKSLEWIDNGCAARIGSDIHGAKKLYAPWLKCKKYILKKLDGKI